jgi:hypothetical protein
MRSVFDWLFNLVHKSMPKPFHPVKLDSLSKIDEFEIPYHQELVDILGIVAEGQACYPQSERPYDIHGFSIEAWRKVGGPIISKEIFVQRLVPKKAKPHPLDEFPAYSILKCRALLTTDQSRAVLWELIPQETEDKELLRVAKQLQRPLIIRTAELGEMTYNRSLKRFEGMVTWCGNDEVTVSVTAKESKPDPEAHNTARAMLAAQKSWQERITTFAAEKLLPTWIEHWRQEDAPTLDSNEFIRRISLSSIDFNEDGRFTFWFDDGDIFLGHIITVWGNLIDGPTDAVFQG